jgi:hypothetical protein
VVVVGLDTVRGRAAVVGSLVSLQTGREIRRASVALEPDPSTERLRALARYLAGEEPSSGIEVDELRAAPRVARDVPDPSEGGRWGGWKWLTAAGGVAALATGITLLVLDGKCKDSVAGRACTDLYDNAPTDYVALGIGAVLGGFTVYLFATDGRAPSRAAYIVPTSSGATVGVGWRF